MKDFDAQKRFWMVVNLSRGAPTKRHETYADAVNEARRLAIKSHDRECFVVVASVSVYQRQEPELDRYELGPSGSDFYKLLT